MFQEELFRVLHPKNNTFIYPNLFQKYALYNGLLHSGRLQSYCRTGVSAFLYICNNTARLGSPCPTLINSAILV
jgi:hypothetical protein